MLKIITLAAAAAITFVAVSDSAFAAGPAQFARSLQHFSSKTLPEGKYALAPFAFMRFCAANPTDCRGEGRKVTIAWKGKTRSLIHRVNWTVNRKMIPLNDAVESWDAGRGAGDCEDNALTKRRELIKLGIPSSAVRIATARTSRGIGHAVLIVSTSAGDMVLDNRTSAIKLWNRTDLTFLRVASVENPRIWKAVSR